MGYPNENMTCTFSAYLSVRFGLTLCLPYFIIFFAVFQNVKSKRNKSDALRDLVAFVQFKKREKHPWRRVNFTKFSSMGVFHLF